MMRRRTPGSGTLLAAALLAAGPAPSLNAQEAPQPPPTADCRCVDQDGNEIDDCVCFRTPGRSWEAFGPVFGWRGPRARIGVAIDPEQRAADDTLGARITGVMDGGPADRAALEEGDIVVRVGGSSVLSPLPDAVAERRLDLDRSVPVQRLQALVGALAPGEDVEVEVLRDGARFTATVVPDDARDVTVFGSVPTGRGFGVLPRRFRMEVEPWRFRDLDDAEWRTLREGLEGLGGRVDVLRERFGRGGLGMLMGSVAGLELAAIGPGLSDYFGTDRGVLLLSVPDGSPLGLVAGDVILEIGGREVDEPVDVRRILGSYEEDEEVLLRIVRRQGELEVLGRAP